jgi:hypothetical protein
LSFFKKLKKKVSKVVKVVGRSAAKVVKYAAPVVGAVVAGPLGAAAGGALGAAAAQVGPTKNRSAQLKRSLVYGGAVAGGTAVLGMASGAGIGASVISSVGRIFNPSGPVVPTSNQPGDELVSMDPIGSSRGSQLIDGAGLPGTMPQGGSGFNVLPNFNPFGQTAGQIGGDPTPGDPRQGGGFLDGLGNMIGIGGGQEPGFFETEEGKPDYVKLGLAAGAVYFLFLKKRAA